MMMSMYFYSLVLLFLSGVLVFILKYNHFLIMLMSLEFMVLSIYVLLFFYCTQFMFENFISMFYLTFSVCESSLGLSLLVLLIRSYGSDMLMIFDSLW
uniref:NADH dehydrogenase subunit 4L n=1 Tax=Dendroctonus rufipennis TaxID=77170 RepID=UPI0020295482|nr:NADH dehydrogenase subunit 4L [Dendroctonus rufipennis]UQK95008.1 NADH dehydrogenase subunit 4L [Dendroctonus rufipennis]